MRPGGTYSSILGWRVGSGGAKGGIGIDADHSCHKLDSVLASPVGEDGVRGWSVWDIYLMGYFYCGAIARGLASQG